MYVSKDDIYIVKSYISMIGEALAAQYPSAESEDIERLEYWYGEDEKANKLLEKMQSQYERQSMQREIKKRAKQIYKSK